MPVEAATDELLGLLAADWRLRRELEHLRDKRNLPQVQLDMGNYSVSFMQEVFSP
jgi:hypothetical protein